MHAVCIIITVSVVVKHMRWETPSDPAIETKSFKLFDFFSFNFNAVKGSIIFLVSCISSRTIAGTLPLRSARHTLSKPKNYKQIDSSLGVAFVQRSFLGLSLLPSFLRPHRPHVYGASCVFCPYLHVRQPAGPAWHRPALTLTQFSMPGPSDRTLYDDSDWWRPLMTRRNPPRPREHHVTPGRRAFTARADQSSRGRRRGPPGEPVELLAPFPEHWQTGSRSARPGPGAGPLGGCGGFT